MSHRESDLKRYRAVVQGKNKETTIFTSSERIALQMPPAQAAFVYAEVPDKPNIPTSVHRFAPTVIARLEALGVCLTNDPLFRLMSASFTGPDLLFHFALSAFFDYRFTAGLMEDELKDTLASHDGNIGAILKDPSAALPVRTAILPNIEALQQYSNRITIGGDFATLNWPLSIL